MTRVGRLLCPYWLIALEVKRWLSLFFFMITAGQRFLTGILLDRSDASLASLLCRCGRRDVGWEYFPRARILCHKTLPLKSSAILSTKQLDYIES